MKPIMTTGTAVVGETIDQVVEPKKHTEVEAVAELQTPIKDVFYRGENTNYLRQEAIQLDIALGNELYAKQIESDNPLLPELYP